MVSEWFRCSKLINNSKLIIFANSRKAPAIGAVHIWRKTGRDWCQVADVHMVIVTGWHRSVYNHSVATWIARDCHCADVHGPARANIDGWGRHIASGQLRGDQRFFSFKWHWSAPNSRRTGCAHCASIQQNHDAHRRLFVRLRAWSTHCKWFLVEWSDGQFEINLLMYVVWPF